MKTVFKALACATFLLAVVPLMAAPTFTGVVNPASNIPPGLPNYGIAQGSIFVIYGAGLGPAALAQASFLPLPTTAGLAGTSITVTVNGVALAVPMLYTVQTQVAAILPSSTPVGTGTLALTFNGATNTTPIKVVASNFGISTVNQSGSGPAVVTNPDYTLVTASKPARVGDVLVIWGTGLGATAGNDAALPAQRDLGTAIQVLVGGVSANVLYRGRSAGPGLDQINIAVPQGVTPGCFVSLVIQTGNLVSNSTSIPISANSGPCSEPANPNTVLTGLGGKSSYKIGGFSLQSQAVTASFNGQTYSQTGLGAGASFSRYPQSLIDLQAAAFPSPGSCRVVISTAAVNQPAPDPTLFTPTALDAGPSMTLAPPTGASVAMPALAPGYYSAVLPSIPAGSWQFSNGSGGADVGAFSIRFAAPEHGFVWTNQAAASVVDRTKALSIQWTGGDPRGFVFISLLGFYTYNNTSVIGVSAQCHASVGAGQFTVPANILLNFPAPGPEVAFTNTSISVLAYSPIQIVSVPGLDAAYAATIVAVTNSSLTYK